MSFNNYWYDNLNGCEPDIYGMTSIYERIANKEWLTKDGRTLSISCMNTHYIASCIKWLKTSFKDSNFFTQSYLSLFQKELRSRGI